MFFLPIGDEPNPPVKQPVSKWLLVSNIGIFIFIALPLKMKSVDVSDPILNEMWSLKRLK